MKANEVVELRLGLFVCVTLICYADVSDNESFVNGAQQDVKASGKAACN